MSLGQLNGLTVLVTRPRDQSESVAAHIVEQGGSPLIFPTLEIIPVEPSGGWASLPQKLKSADIVVFTSANAVRQLMTQTQAQAQQIFFETQAELAAIGTATQAAMTEFGLSCHWVPMKDFRSQGLLALPVFQSVKNKKILLFAGVGGREYLQDVLNERGAQVEKVAVYRRDCPRSDKAILEQFMARQQPKIILSTSVESLSNLLTLSSEVGSIKELPLLVISERIAQAAKEHNFKDIIIAENASDEAIINALINHL